MGARKTRQLLSSSLQATSVGQFAALVSEIRDIWFGDGDPVGPWFRGLEDASYLLIPGAYREDGTDESEIREEFELRAPALTEFRGRDEWDLYFVMQHHGALTRLLDWTDGALLALYFAIRKSSAESDAVVWVLDPWWLNEQVIGTSEVLPAGHSKIAKWLPKPFSKADLPRLPVALYPPHVMRRVGVQKSCFTIHGSLRDGIYRVALRKRERRLRKIVVPKSKIDRVRLELATCGIVESTVFPDLEGLARELNVKWSEKPWFR